MEELKKAVMQYTLLKQNSLKESADQKQIAESLEALHNHTEQIQPENEFAIWVKKNLLLNIQEEKRIAYSETGRGEAEINEKAHTNGRV